MNETWQTKCEQCTCDGDTLSVQCEPITCPPLSPVTCDKPGYEIVNKSDGCCYRQKCGECIPDAYKFKTTVSDANVLAA